MVKKTSVKIRDLPELVSQLNAKSKFTKYFSNSSINR